MQIGTLYCDYKFEYTKCGTFPEYRPPPHFAYLKLLYFLFQNYIREVCNIILHFSVLISCNFWFNCINLNKLKLFVSCDLYLLANLFVVVVLTVTFTCVPCLWCVWNVTVSPDYEIMCIPFNCWIMSVYSGCAKRLQDNGSIVKGNC